ncbi:MAG: hypothetical protein ABS882_09875, partial [Lysinibacillus sp.]
MVAIKEKVAAESKPVVKKQSLFKVRESIPKKWYVLGTVSAFAGILAIWSLLSYLQLVNPVFLPTPVEVLVAFGASMVDSS